MNPRTQTPINATLVTMALASLPALLLDIETLASMVSVGTLFVLCMVCSAVLWRAHYQPSVPRSASVCGGLLGTIFLTSIGEGITSHAQGPGWIQCSFLGKRLVFIFVNCSLLP